MIVVAVIPAYEAAATVGAVVEATRRLLPEVLVVDDGSCDGTGDAARSAGARLLRLDSNRGKGRALRAGFSLALDMGASAVVTLDADGQHEPTEIPRLLHRWQSTGAALVIGSRTDVEAQMTPARRFGYRFSRRAISFFAGIRVQDTQSGFRLYAASLLKEIRLRGTRYELESEVIVKAARTGLRVESVPIRLARVDGTATSHFRPWRDTTRICRIVVSSRFRREGCS